jgi:biopolymer transport protein ExbD
MAGGGGGLSAPERSKRGKASKRKKKKRLGFTLDMTPLVDITFLLLTFFMFTTSMAAPQVMEMSIPPEKSEVEVKEKELLTIIIRKDGNIFWHIANDDPAAIKMKDIQKLAENENIRAGVKNKLITVLKVDENAAYGRMVSVLDQLNLAEMKITEVVEKEKGPDGKSLEKRKRKFTLAPLTEEEQKKIEGL